VDAAFGVHGDARGHNCGTMSLRAGSVYSLSTKQKLVTRSSTQSKLVAVHDVHPQIEWTVLFLEALRYPVEVTILYQDNISAILLEKNGKGSSSKGTKHLHMRYFYIKEKVEDDTVKIEHCPTKQMVVDFLQSRYRVYNSTGYGTSS
jgi:hypothetical protein